MAVKLLMTFLIFGLATIHGEEDCEDKSADCKKHMNTGWYTDCQIPGGFLFDHCKKSCGLCGKVLPTPQSGCHDYEEKCKEWQKSNQCITNPKFMKRYCKATCYGCSGGSGDTCKDTTTSCEKYINKGIYSDCKLPGGFLFDHCKKTCNLCGKVLPTPRPGCHDFEKDCKAWKKSNECITNPKFMIRYCKATCGGCGGATISPPIPKGCVDAHPDICAKKQSRCPYDRAYMSKNCRETCKMCSSGTTCFDKDSHCARWKEQGKCKKSNVFYSWMLRNCDYSCTACKNLNI